MEETLQRQFHLYTQRFAQLLLLYTREQTAANWLLVKEMQQRLYTVQVHMLDGNTPHALDLLPVQPWPPL